MMIIDSDDYKSAGIEVMTFPGGEPHAKLPIYPEDMELVLFLKLRTWLDVGYAACVIDALIYQGKHFMKVFMPYYPGARQDRSDGAAPLTAGLVADLLNVAYATIFDGHSHVCIAYASENLMPTILDIPHKPDVVGIIAPDTGAVERATAFQEKFYPGSDLIMCSKKRDPINGGLSGYVMPRLQVKGRYIVVDDICDGGGTFNLLARAFAEDPIGEQSKLDLFVSHGIFSKGIAAISPLYETITTTDSWCRYGVMNSPRLNVIQLLPYYLEHIKQDV